MKVFAWIPLAMGVGIAIYEGAVWYGKTDLAVVIIALAIAVSLQSVYMLTKKPSL